MGTGGVQWNKGAIDKIAAEHGEVIRQSLNEVAANPPQGREQIRLALVSAARRRGVRFDPSEAVIDKIASAESVEFT